MKRCCAHAPECELSTWPCNDLMFCTACKQSQFAAAQAGVVAQLTSGRQVRAGNGCSRAAACRSQAGSPLQSKQQERWRSSCFSLQSSKCWCHTCFLDILDVGRVCCWWRRLRQEAGESWMHHSSRMHAALAGNRLNTALSLALERPQLTATGSQMSATRHLLCKQLQHAGAAFNPAALH